MDPIAVQALRPHLRPRERLLWAGRPAPVPYAWSGQILNVVVGITILFSALVTLAYGVLTMPPTVALLVGLVAVAVGAGAITGIAMPLQRLREAPGIVYGVTDARALILYPGRAGLRSFKPDSFTRLRTRPGLGGATNLWFTTRTSNAFLGSSRQLAAGTRPDGFAALPDAQAVAGASQALERLLP